MCFDIYRVDGSEYELKCIALCGSDIRTATVVVDSATEESDSQLQQQLVIKLGEVKKHTKVAQFQSQVLQSRTHKYFALEAKEDAFKCGLLVFQHVLWASLPPSVEEEGFLCGATFLCKRGKAMIVAVSFTHNGWCIYFS